MLGSNDVPTLALFRPQNHRDSNPQELFGLKECCLLPSNSYPSLTPSFTAHWTGDRVVVRRRSGAVSKTVLALSIGQIDLKRTFPEKNGENSDSKATLNTNFTIKSAGKLLNWFEKMWDRSGGKIPLNQDLSEIFIVKVLPLMIDATQFDALMVVKWKSRFGFLRFNQMIADSAQPAIHYEALPILNFDEHHNGAITFLNWKTLLFAVENQSPGRIFVSKLSSSTSTASGDWSEICRFPGGFCDSILVENDVLDQDVVGKSVVLVGKDVEEDFLVKGVSVEYSALDEIKCTRLKFKLPTELLSAQHTIGFLQGNQIFLLKGNFLYNASLNPNSQWVRKLQVPTLPCDQDNSFRYLFPWRRDLQVSAVLYVVAWSGGADGDEMEISCYSINCDGDQEELLSGANCICTHMIPGAKGRIRAAFASSTFELFLAVEEAADVDEGNGDLSGVDDVSEDSCSSSGPVSVYVYSGLLLATSWDWSSSSGLQPLESAFEFAHWFNLLGPFPLPNTSFYWQRRRAFPDGRLFIESERLERLRPPIVLGTFPPDNWQSLATLCRQLMSPDCNDAGNNDFGIEVVAYLLMAGECARDRLNRFYATFGLSDRSITQIELFFSLDHGKLADAVGMACSRGGGGWEDSAFVTKLIETLSVADDQEEASLQIVARYAAGRLIPLDILMEMTSIDAIPKSRPIRLLMRSLLHDLKEENSSVLSVLEWMKALFSWLRPDDRLALIPLPRLHQFLLEILIEEVLLLPDTGPCQFKSRAEQLISVPFEAEMMVCVVEKLRGEVSGVNCDRAAWILVRSCAARNDFRWYRELLATDFSTIQSPEIRIGINSVLQVIRGIFEENHLPPILMKMRAVEADAPMESKSPLSLSISFRPGARASCTASPVPSTSPIAPAGVSSVPMAASPRLYVPGSPHRSHRHSPSLATSVASPSPAPRHFPTKTPTPLVAVETQQVPRLGPDSRDDCSGDEFESELYRYRGKRDRMSYIPSKHREVVEEDLDQTMHLAPTNTKRSRKH